MFTEDILIVLHDGKYNSYNVQAMFIKESLLLILLSNLQFGRITFKKFNCHYLIIIGDWFILTYTVRWLAMDINSTDSDLPL